MTARYHRTGVYLKKEKHRCKRCGHHGRDVRGRLVPNPDTKDQTDRRFKVWCNNCAASAY